MVEGAPVTQKEPLTREEVLRRREEFLKRLGEPGAPDVFDLSGRLFEYNIDLQREEFSGLSDLADLLMKKERSWWKTNFEDAIFPEAKLKGARLAKCIFKGAHLEEADLEGARLGSANLECAHLDAACLDDARLSDADLKDARLVDASLKGAELYRANLQGSVLNSANLQGTKLKGTRLTGVHLEGAQLEGASLEGADWSKGYILGEERDGKYKEAESLYLWFKLYYTKAGMYDVAGEFHYREWECKRKALPWWRQLLKGYWLYGPLAGYGERPVRTVIAAFLFLAFFTLGYWLGGAFESFGDSTYFSGVSFIALGYGSWVVPEPPVWARFAGVFETFVGFFLMSLFLVTFVRRMTR